jgi:alkanesulfonate monooxygenase SsuD/methylene tetrahydromethanopterin reductase-like flavin-dependent oxidoreductase (luciferase family)
MIFSVGAGWNLEEMRNHGTDPKQRFKILRERVEACKRCGPRKATYHGEFVSFDQSCPGPGFRPHPPILVGGSGQTC